MNLTAADKRGSFKRKIVKHLYFDSELSCADLSQSIGKSIPFVTKYLTELIEEGRVIEKGFANSTGGRKPLMYSLKPGTVYVVSVAMDQLITRIALMDSNNTFVGEVEKFSLSLAKNSEALSELTLHLKGFIKRSGISPKNIAGIGIGMPGFVNPEKGINYSYLQPPTGSITSYLESALNLPVFIDNDSSLIALAEHKWGAAKNMQNVMVINVGWGVGLGIIVNGKLFRGQNGFAGEFSHIPLFDNNKLCICGKYGCLETEASLLVVAEQAIKGLEHGKQSIIKKLTGEDIETVAKNVIDAAKSGDKYSIEILGEAGYKIGKGVAILIHLLNPQTIVISGIGAQAGKIWIAPIQQAVNEHCIPRIAEHTEITVSSLGYNSELVGAAACVMDQYENIKSTPTSTKYHLKQA